MNKYHRLQGIVLSIILFLVWFEILCFVLMFVGSILDWSFLTERFSNVFFSAFGLGLGGLLALAILHITLSFQSVSFSLNKIAQEKSGTDDLPNTKERKIFNKQIGYAVIAMFVVVFLFWIAEYNVKQYKMRIISSSAEALVISPMAEKVKSLLKQNASIKDLLDVRDAMQTAIEEKGAVLFLVPMNKAGQDVYYETRKVFSNSDLSKSVNEADLIAFIPWSKDEKKKFTEMLRNHKPFYSSTGYSYRFFYPVLEKENILFVIFIDTDRQVTDKYWSGSR